MDAAIRGSGAVPAITALIAGRLVAGVTPDELQRFLGGSGIAKASARDLAPAMAQGRDAATTVAASLRICHAAGLPVFATGGIGGVHREPAFDESADLLELSRTPMVVVCAGAKSVLDLPATVERLETLGVTVLGYRTSEFPGFHTAATGLAVPARAESAQDVVDVFRAQRSIGHPGAVLVVQPPPAESALALDELAPVIDAALAAARAEGVRGGAVTPWLLAAVDRATGGRALAANLALLEANARLAGGIASCLTRVADS